MEIDILIDQLTDCLIDSDTGQIMKTEYRVHTCPLTKAEYKHWNFNWKIAQNKGYFIYELFLKNDSVVQGRIALKINGGAADVNIAETAPHNFGHRRKYKGVGGHLFAIACQFSLEAGCDGVVAFTSKSGLSAYYKKALGAIEIMPNRLVIFEREAQLLLNKYMRK